MKKKSFLFKSASVLTSTWVNRHSEYAINREVPFYLFWCGVACGEFNSRLSGGILGIFTQKWHSPILVLSLWGLKYKSESMNWMQGNSAAEDRCSINIVTNFPLIYHGHYVGWHGLVQFHSCGGRRSVRTNNDIHFLTLNPNCVIQSYSRWALPPQSFSLEDDNDTIHR